MAKPKKQAQGGASETMVFIIASIGGIVAILLVRVLGDSVYSGLNVFRSAAVSAFDILSVALAVAIIASYALFIHGKKYTNSSALDRASDNVYYLGLLFTLASLAYSLVKLALFVQSGESQATYVNDLLPDFGVALFSTIAGILGRILLQQTRGDYEKEFADNKFAGKEEQDLHKTAIDTHSEARHELGLATQQLRAQIGVVLADLSGLAKQTNTVLAELNATISKTLQDTASENAEVVGSVAEDINLLKESINTQISEVTDFTKQASDNFNIILDQIRDQTEGFENLAGNIAEVTSQTAKIAAQQQNLLDELTNSVAALRRTFSEESLAEFMSSMNAAQQRMENLSDNLEAREDQFNASANRFDGLLGNLDSIVKEAEAAKKRR